MAMLPLTKGKDERAGAGAGTMAVAPTAMCDLCDLYTRSGLAGKWDELAAVYDQRRNDDNFREILDLSAPDARLTDLNGWHLERMAVGEFGPAAGTNASDLAAIKRDSRAIKQTLRKLLRHGEGFRAQREQLDARMAQQRDALAVELSAAKEFLGQTHLLHASDAATVEVGEPAPVEERLRATVQAPERSGTVDLSASPSI